MFSRKIPVYYILLCIVATAVVTYIAARFFFRDKFFAAHSSSEAAAIPVTYKPDCTYDITRLTGYRHISPIVSAAHECEAESLMPLKMTIASYIDHEQTAGNVLNASVYIRCLNNDDWINVNPTDAFHPASLLKVPQLITYLKMAEVKPGLLDKEFEFSGSAENMPTQYYSAKTLQPGHKYSIKELFHFMIVYSDNNANVELVNRMDMAVFNKTFKDLRLTAPDLMDRNYVIGTRDYSKFLEALYNAAYLSISASEYATELLVEATFKDGILKKLPRNVPVAHKMGEWGDGRTVELHDCGIVYIENRPYIITVMTRGNDMEKLSETIGTISRLVFDAMSSPSL